MFKCKICGREFKRESNLNWHEATCKGIIKKPKVMHKRPIKNIIKDKDVESECIKSKSGKHDLVMLNRNIPIQAQAIAMGYSAFCKQCKELV